MADNNQLEGGRNGRGSATSHSSEVDAILLNFLSEAEKQRSGKLMNIMDFIRQSKGRERILALLKQAELDGRIDELGDIQDQFTYTLKPNEYGERQPVKDRLTELEEQNGYPRIGQSFKKGEVNLDFPNSELESKK